MTSFTKASNYSIISHFTNMNAVNDTNFVRFTQKKCHFRMTQREPGTRVLRAILKTVLFSCPRCDEGAHKKQNPFHGKHSKQKLSYPPKTTTNTAMVSQLSARLLMTAGQAASAAPRTVNSTSGSNSSGNASSGPLKRRNLGAAPTLNRKTSETKRGGARKKIPYEDRMLTTATSSSSLGGSSGYLGDFEQKLNTSWPASIDLMSRATKRALLEESTNSQGDNKRSKTAPPSKEELNFMASTVERDLKSGGVQRPKIQVNRSRISSVDMKSVSLIHSKDFDKISSAEKKGFGYNLLDCPGTLHEILKETSCLYNKLSDSSLPAAFSKVLESVHLAEEQGTDDSEKQVDSSDTESSTSSFTEESDSAELSDSSRIQRDLKSPDHDTKSSSRITTDDAPTPVSAVIPIGEALSITSHPKYVIHSIVTSARANADLFALLYTHPCLLLFSLSHSESLL